jgi:hypothetical protein
MRYIEFKDAVRRELQRNPEGLTWIELQQRLALPYDRPCPTWTNKLEEEIGLSRTKGSGRAFLWRVRHKVRSHQ